MTNLTTALECVEYERHMVDGAPIGDIPTNELTNFYTIRYTYTYGQSRITKKKSLELPKPPTLDELQAMAQQWIEDEPEVDIARDTFTFESGL